MGNNGNSNGDAERETTEAAAKKKTALSPAMTLKERRHLVKRFVIAFLDGEIEIDFPNARDIAAREPSFFGGHNPTAEHLHTEIAEKMAFLKCVSIFLNETTSEEEMIKITNDLLEFLTSFRIGHRIKGKFMATPEYDVRIGRLERDVFRIEKMLEEMRILLKAAGILP